MNPRQLARMGEFYLEEAILTVLLETTSKNKCVGAAAIRKYLGIYSRAKMNDTITASLLYKLEESKRVERCKTHKGKFKLTDDEYERRREDKTI